MSNIVNGFNFDLLPIRVEYVGKVDDKKWPHFLWNAIFNGKNEFFTVPYKCGMGHVEKKPGAMPMPNPPYKKGTLAYEAWEKQKMRPKKPKNSDIMYSLLSDIEAADMSFNNWCDEFGYSNDSMKAFKIYQTCCEYAVFIRKIFTAAKIQEMRTALGDY